MDFSLTQLSRGDWVKRWIRFRYDWEDADEWQPLLASTMADEATRKAYD